MLCPGAIAATSVHNKARIGNYGALLLSVHGVEAEPARLRSGKSPAREPDAWLLSLPPVRTCAHIARVGGRSQGARCRGCRRRIIARRRRAHRGRRGGLVRHSQDCFFSKSPGRRDVGCRLNRQHGPRPCGSVKSSSCSGQFPVGHGGHPLSTGSLIGFPDRLRIASDGLVIHIRVRGEVITNLRARGR